MCCGKMIRMPRRRPPPPTKEEIEAKKKEDEKKIIERMIKLKAKRDRIN